MMHTRARYRVHTARASFFVEVACVVVGQAQDVESGGPVVINVACR